MEEESAYNKEYRLYMEYALQRYLIEKKGYSEYDANIKVMRDFEEVEQEAKQARYL